MKWLRENYKELAEAIMVTALSLFTALASAEVLQPDQKWLPLLAFAFFVGIVLHRLWSLSVKLRQTVKIIRGDDGDFRHSYQDRVLYRIGVKGLSASHLENVNVYLESIEPPVLPCLPAHLHIMNDNLPVGSRESYKESFEINSGDPPKFIDVVIIPNPEAPDNKRFEIQHIVNHLAGLVAGTYRLTILVTTKSGQPDRAKFLVVPDDDEKYRFIPDDGREVDLFKLAQKPSDGLLILLPAEESANIRFNKTTGSYLGYSDRA